MERIEKMSIYIMNTKTTFKASAAEANEYFNGEDCSVIFIKKQSTGKIIAAQSYGTYTEDDIYCTSHLMLDTGNGSRDAGRGDLVGLLVNGESFGEVPVKTVPFYVYK